MQNCCWICPSKYWQIVEKTIRKLLSVMNFIWFIDEVRIWFTTNLKMIVKVQVFPALYVYTKNQSDVRATYDNSLSARGRTGPVDWQQQLLATLVWCLISPVPPQPRHTPGILSDCHECEIFCKNCHTIDRVVTVEKASQSDNHY